MAISKLNPENLTGPHKAAVFLLSMGEEFTTSFFKQLDERSMKMLGKYMADIEYISSDVLNKVMNEFVTNFRSDTNLAVSGREFLKQIVSKSLNEEEAREVFKVIGDGSADVPFSDFAYVPADDLVNMIKGEHPQTIALIMSYIPQEKAAEILNLLPEGMKADIALRILQMGQVPDDLIRELDETLKKDLSSVGLVTRKFDGVETLANILNEVDGKTEEYVISYIEKEYGDLAEKIRQKMFVFEDLLEIDDRGFREILQNVDNELLAKALKTASEDLKEKIFSNLSERAADMLREDMDVMGPTRLKEVEEAQQTIIRIAKRLDAEGKISIGGKGKEDIYV